MTKGDKSGDLIKLAEQDSRTLASVHANLLADELSRTVVVTDFDTDETVFTGFPTKKPEPPAVGFINEAVEALNPHVTDEGDPPTPAATIPTDMIRVYSQPVGEPKKRSYIGMIADWYKDPVDVCYRLFGNAERLIGGKIVKPRGGERHWLLVLT